ncbi:hypothetical protein K432DRAFT_401814 [Lepidopterella palustris CBS 459.81]|uniref:Uncharacterized protein n=1 Tax=Lepidopterella palustris CBS 459.81 TaxID=1314670 RepID=A0A8E2EGT8_9PEZI|nr:hypothetical protein K432DRAFT_401814 [Lepidopterella palustris CBS 459.81]
MAPRNPRFQDFSAVSPDETPQRYDPFDPPLDPLEMQSFTRPSFEAGILEEGPREPSPDVHVRRNESQSSFVSSLHGEGRTNTGYSPVPRTYSETSANTGYPPIPQSHSMGRLPPRKSMGGTSVHTVGSTLTPFKTADPDTQALVERRAGEIAQWTIHWQTPAVIVVLFVAGVMGAVGHHLFYQHLDGKPAEDQLKMIRYGTALAFFTKATLVGSVVMCYRQRIWHTFRKRAMTIHAIDGLFSATEDPTQFINMEMVRNAKLASFMAVASWLIPIAAVLSPGSLTSEVMTSTNDTHCPTVASLNFSHESTFNFRNESLYAGSSLIYYNSTDITATQPGWFDYFDQPSKNARRLTITSAYLQKPVQDIGASNKSCDVGWNCTYSINFEGPGYNCLEVANSSNPNAQGLIDMGAPINITSLAPQGSFIYQSSVDIGEYADPQTPTNDKGEPAEGPPYPDLLGVFQSEPALWIGYSINTSKPYDPSSPYYAQWGAVHEPKVFKCLHYHTNYTALLRYVDAIQNVTIANRTFIAPIVDTVIMATPGDPENPTITPYTNFVRPNTDVGKYKLTAAYHAMGSLLRNFLRGEISYESKFPVTKSDISETRLIDSRTSYPVQDLMAQVQSVYEDMILTLLSEPHMIVASTDSVPCMKSRSVIVFAYHAEGLWIGYAIVVAFAFAFLIVGAWSIYQNGVASDTQFSRIMVTTRNPTIDRLSVGACLGGDPFPPELRKTKLRFGVLLEEESREGFPGKVEHCTFGTRGETKEIQKYGTYAGLKKWRGERGDVEEKEGLLRDEEKVGMGDGGGG